jgi:hypothetical protein
MRKRRGRSTPLLAEALLCRIFGKTLSETFGVTLKGALGL